MTTLGLPQPRSGFFRAVAVLAGGAATGQAITLAASPVLSRLFDPDEFGVLALYTGALVIAMAVSSLRLEQAIGIPRSPQIAFNVMTLAVGISAVVALFVLVLGLLAPELLLRFTDVDVPYVVLWLLPVGILFGSLHQALEIWALRTRQYSPIASTKIRQGITTALAQIGAGLLGAGAVGLTAGHALGQSVGAGSLVAKTVRSRALRRPRLRELRSALARYKHFPLLATPAALLNSASLQVPIFVLASTFGAAVTGQFFFSLRITMAPAGLIGRSISNVFYAEATALGRHRPVALRKLLLATSAKSFLLGLPVALILLFAAPVAFSRVFGDNWQLAGDFSQVMAAMLLANFALTPVERVFFVIERQTQNLGTNIARMLLSVGSTVIPASLGLPSTEVVLIYSAAMAVYYLGVLGVAVALLTSMARATQEDGLGP